MLLPATLDDLPDIMDIEGRCFTSEQFSVPLYISFILRPEYEIWTERQEARTVGTLVLGFWEGEPVGHVMSVAVHPDHQGKKLGRKLMEHAEFRALEHGCNQLRLEVRRGNMAARELYNHLGYKEIEVLEDYYGPGVDGILYLKDLAPNQ